MKEELGKVPYDSQSQVGSAEIVGMFVVFALALLLAGPFLAYWVGLPGCCSLELC